MPVDVITQIEELAKSMIYDGSDLGQEVEVDDMTLGLQSDAF